MRLPRAQASYDDGEFEEEDPLAGMGGGGEGKGKGKEKIDWEAAAMQLKARGQAVDNRFYKAIRSSGRGLLSKVEQLKENVRFT